MFRYWKAVLRDFKRRKLRVPLDLQQLRVIKPLTWRECREWLTLAGLKVRRSSHGCNRFAEMYRLSTCV